MSYLSTAAKADTAVLVNSTASAVPLAPAVSLFAAVKEERAPEQLGRMPSALVSISRVDFPLVQQKIFASLVYAVTTGIAERPKYDERNEVDYITAEMEIKDDWSIDLKTLRNLSKFNSHNYKYFGEAVMGLKGRTVEINILSKDNDLICPSCKIYLSKNSDRFVCPACGYETDGKGIPKKTRFTTGQSLFSRIGTADDGKVYFTLDPFMQKCIDKKRFYCKFLPSIINSLKRGASHAIYLLLLDYIDEKRGSGQTPFMEVQLFAKLTGSEKYISNFKNLRTFVIDKAIDEINSKTNINAYFDKYDDVKTNGRKIVSIRIRGRYKQSRPIQQTLFDDNDNANNVNGNLDNSKPNEVTLCGQTIDKEGFLEFLSVNANNKSAYKAHIRKLLDDNRLDDKEKRINQYIVYLNEQKIRREQEERQRKTNEIYKTLNDIAVKEKGQSLENLYLWNNQQGFYSFNSIINEDKIIQMCSDLINYPSSKISKRLFTNDEKIAFETKEIRRYEEMIVNPLTVIAPMDEWKAVLDNKQISVFNSAIIRKATGNIASISTFRSIERKLREGGRVWFEADGNRYVGYKSNSDKAMVLTLANETKNRSDGNEAIEINRTIKANDNEAAETIATGNSDVNNKSIDVMKTNKTIEIIEISSKAN
jgi:hypothetical protein